jgi:hypothetical protein
VKGECERCGVLGELELEVRGPAVFARCPACRAEYPLRAGSSGTIASVPTSSASASSGASPSEDPRAEPGCPKCGHAPRRGDACPRCGLVFARWSGASAPSLGGASAPDSPEGAEANRLWAQVELTWTTDRHHDAFVEHCQKHGLFAYAAARYRAAQKERGAGAEPIATRKLTLLGTSAEAALRATAAAADVRARAAAAASRRPLLILALVGTITSVVVLAYLVFRDPPAEDEGPGAIPVPAPILPAGAGARPSPPDAGPAPPDAA